MGGSEVALKESIEDAVVVDWAELYRTAFPELVRFLHRKVWDIERAKDLAQETFVRALRVFSLERDLFDGQVVDEEDALQAEHADKLEASGFDV